MRSPTLLPIKMNEAETRASRAIADCTPLTVVPMSWTTAEIDTFMMDVSTTNTNIAIASRRASRELPCVGPGTASPRRPGYGGIGVLSSLWRSARRIHQIKAALLLVPHGGPVRKSRSVLSASRRAEDLEARMLSVDPLI